MRELSYHVGKETPMDPGDTRQLPNVCGDKNFCLEKSQRYNLIRAYMYAQLPKNLVSRIPPVFQPMYNYSTRKSKH